MKTTYVGTMDGVRYFVIRNDDESRSGLVIYNGCEMEVTRFEWSWVPRGLHAIVRCSLGEQFENSIPCNLQGEVEEFRVSIEKLSAPREEFKRKIKDIEYLQAEVERAREQLARAERKLASLTEELAIKKTALGDEPPVPEFPNIIKMAGSFPWFAY